MPGLLLLGIVIAVSLLIGAICLAAGIRLMKNNKSKLPIVLLMVGAVWILEAVGLACVILAGVR